MNMINCPVCGVTWSPAVPVCKCGYDQQGRRVATSTAKPDTKLRNPLYAVEDTP